MCCLSALSLAHTMLVNAEEDPLLEMEFFLFLAQSEQLGETLTTPLDLDDWEPAEESGSDQNSKQDSEETQQ